MELERLDNLVQRSFRKIRHLLKTAPEVPSQTPIQGLGDLIPDTQDSADNQGAELPAQPTTVSPESENSVPDSTVEHDQSTAAQKIIASNLNFETNTTNPINPIGSLNVTHEVEATSSTASGITTVDSLGFAPGLTSSVSSRPSEIVVSSDFIGAVIFAQKIIVAPNMRNRIDPELLTAWERKISDRLWNDLDTLGTGDVVALEFHMAGENKKNLKPTIIITCDGAKSQRHNITKVKSLKWLEPFRLKCCVVKNSDKRRLQALSKPKDDSTLLPYEVVANIDDSAKTLCGVTAALKNPAVESVTPFRLGGLIKVDDEVFCLTAGHILAPIHSESLSTAINQTQKSEVDNVTEVDDPSSIFTIGDWVSDDETVVPSIDLNDGNESFVLDLDTLDHASTLPPLNFDDLPIIGNVESQFANDRALASQCSISASDWGLVKLRTQYHGFSNLIQIPGQNSKTVIEDIITENELFPGQVWAVTQSSCPKSGFLSLGSAFIFLYGRRFRVRQIAFEEALVPGDSGAWVIQNGKLCGHIIAGRTGLKWAYMMTIEDIFGDIKQNLHAKEVRLPRASERFGYPAPGRANRENPKSDTNTPGPKPIKPSALGLSEAKPSVKTGSLAKYNSRFPRAPKNDSRNPRRPPSSNNAIAGIMLIARGQNQHEPDSSNKDSKVAGQKRRPARWEVLCIAMGGLIGTNLYANNAKALSTAGPAGALTALAIVGFIVIMIMECVSEMTQLFPVSTMFNSVQQFVDKDIALLVGIAYWQEPLHSFVASARDTSREVGPTNCQGFQHNNAVADSSVVGLLYCIPFVTYGFIGVETITLMGALMQRPRYLATLQHLASYMALSIVLLLAVLEYINIGWKDGRLPSPWFQYTDAHWSTTLSVLVAKDLDQGFLPSLVVGSLIYTTVSSSNIVLYVASRALLGVVQSIQPSDPIFKRLVRNTTSVTRFGVPITSIIVSAVAFWWLPVIAIARESSMKEVSRQPGAPNSVRKVSTNSDDSLLKLLHYRVP
ncbi:hypothetical protein LTR84_013052 [Exophiala bonariae]|uniref:Amino acid permease/ SLC12A domain-containing protein n=1 Tax=Exophiala bonariae TaxID=1690606 RepID=A0AAV9NEX4_9EURO|nr:hypothetical protein LTR84_013052 [Exophiala bonariae]